MKKYYKVVARFNDKLYSCAMSSLKDKSNVEYIAGKFVKPKIINSKLFVFSELSQAQSFSDCGNGEIWECEVKGPTTKPKYISLGGCDECFIEFWTSKRKAELPHVRYSLVEGARLVKAVKLTKRIK